MTKETIDNHHPEYDRLIRRWEKNRDAVIGQDAIKQGTESYLPRLPSQSDPDYKVYLDRSVYTNFSGRTVDGLTGLVNRKEPEVNLPAAINQSDVTIDGQSLLEFADHALEESIITGRGGILVDYPSVSAPEGMSKTEAEAAGLRPYLSFYPAEAWINWATGRVNNRVVLTKVVLCEHGEDTAGNCVEQRRALILEDDGCHVEVWQKAEKGDWAQVSDALIIINGAPVWIVPFVPTPASVRPIKSPISDLVDQNLAHYKNSADYENALHVEGTPTPVIVGTIVTADGKPATSLRLGTNEALQLQTGGSASYLSVASGIEEGLGSAMERKEAAMAILGAHILVGDKRQVEAAETAAIHRAGENSALASLAKLVSKSIERALQILVEWSGASADGVSFKLNTDYDVAGLSAADVLSLVQAWMNGGLPTEALYYNLKQGERIPDGYTVDDFKVNVKEPSPVPSVPRTGEPVV